MVFFFKIFAIFGGIVVGVWEKNNTKQLKASPSNEYVPCRRVTESSNIGKWDGIENDGNRKKGGWRGQYELFALASQPPNFDALRDASPRDDSPYRIRGTPVQL